MIFTALAHTCNPISLEVQEDSQQLKIIARHHKVEILTEIVDILLAIGTLAAGILGATSIIPLPPSAAYLLIGVGGTLLLIDLMLLHAVISVKFSNYDLRSEYKPLCGD